MKRKILAISVLLITSTSPVQASEIAGTRVQGDVVLNCEYGRSVEVNATTSEIWSYCSSPITPVQITYGVQVPISEVAPELIPPDVIQMNRAISAATTTASPDTTTVVTDTATAKIETATVLSNIDFTSPNWLSEIMAWFNNFIKQFYAILEGLKK
jgi:hypothetical protein